MKAGGSAYVGWSMCNLEGFPHLHYLFPPGQIQAKANLACCAIRRILPKSLPRKLESGNLPPLCTASGTLFYPPGAWDAQQDVLPQLKGSLATCYYCAEKRGLEATAESLDR